MSERSFFGGDNTQKTNMKCLFEMKESEIKQRERATPEEQEAVAR
jgi:hypothetical protein